MLHTICTSRHKLHATDQVWLDGTRIENKEVPQRVEIIRAAVQAARLGRLLPPQDHGMMPILAVHRRDYVAYLQAAYHLNAVYLGKPVPVLVDRSAVTPERALEPPPGFPELRDYYTYDFEDPILAGTWEAAYWGAQCALTAAELVRQGEVAAYALCRPPGHHATGDQYGGFCYLNNAAIAARALSSDGPVAVLDVDYHHGNGTQAIFYSDSTVLYVSLHADPALDYPYYWGYEHERGAGEGLGTNINLALPLGTDDVRYLQTLDRALEVVQDFAPRYLVVSMGLDTLGGDTIGKFAVTLEGWAEVAERIAALGLPTVIVQEGGYRLDMLGQVAVAFLNPFSKA